MTILENSVCSVTPTIQTKQLLAYKGQNVDILELHSQREINSWAHHPFDSWAHELTDVPIFQKDIYFPAQL